MNNITEVQGLIDRIKELEEENKELKKEQKKRGHWIIGRTALGGKTSTCSECNTEVLLKVGGDIKHVFMDGGFCPNCGADMRAEK